MQNGAQSVISLTTLTAQAAHYNPIFSGSSYSALWPGHWGELPQFLLHMETNILAKTSPSLLLTMASVSGSDKLVNMNLISMIKADNGHGLVAHSLQVPPHSTLTLISKLWIMIVPSINLSALVDTNQVTSKQKDQVLVMYFHHCGTMMHVSLYAWLPTFTLPAAHLMHTCSPFLPKPQITSLWSNECYLGKFSLKHG